MVKVLKCKDVVPGCKTILEGRDEVNVVVKADRPSTRERWQRDTGV